MLHPLPRLSLEVHSPVTSFESSAFPLLGMGRLPASFHVYDFTWCEFSRLQISLHDEASEFARLPSRSYRCILAGQPRLLRPGRTCFVASACTGYANRPNLVIRCKDFHLAGFATLSATPQTCCVRGRKALPSCGIDCSDVVFCFSSYAVLQFLEVICPEVSNHEGQG